MLKKFTNSLALSPVRSIAFHKGADVTGTLKVSLEKIMKEAGQLLLSYWHKPIDEIKKEAGFYTQADLEVEEFLKRELVKIKPADFFAEESGETGTENNGFRWVIDPLDGTTNFAHHIPYFCISVALTDHNNPIVAAIYNPLLDEYYYAEKGAGATLNGHSMSVSTPASFADAIIGFGLSYKHAQRGEIVNLAERVSREARAVRHFGAVALDLAYVASGRMDGVIFSHLAWWDVGCRSAFSAGGRRGGY